MIDELKASRVQCALLLSRSGILNHNRFILVHTRINFLPWRNIPTIKFGCRRNKTERRLDVPVTSRIRKNHRDFLKFPRGPPQLWGAAGFKCEAWPWDVGYGGTLHLPCAALPAFAGRSLPASANYRSHHAEDHVEHASTIRVSQSISTKMTLPERVSTSLVEFSTGFLEKVISALSGGISPIRSLGRMTESCRTGQNNDLYYYSILFSNGHMDWWKVGIVTESGKRRGYHFLVLRLDVGLETLTRSKSETGHDGLHEEQIHRDL
jgi:hypothetical protein